MQVIDFQLVPAEIRNRLKASISLNLLGRSSNLVPWSSGMHLLDCSVARLLRCPDLFGMFASVSDFYGQRVVTDGPFDMDSNVQFHEVTLPEDHLIFNAGGECKQMVSGEVGGHVIYRNRAGECRFSPVPVDVTLCRIDNLVPGYPDLYLILYRLQ
jgi:hypothetical protein